MRSKASLQLTLCLLLHPQALEEKERDTSLAGGCHTGIGLIFHHPPPCQLHSFFQSLCIFSFFSSPSTVDADTCSLLTPNGLTSSTGDRQIFQNMEKYRHLPATLVCGTWVIGIIGSGLHLINNYLSIIDESGSKGPLHAWPGPTQNTIERTALRGGRE